MLKITRQVLAVVVLLFLIYGMIWSNYNAIHIMVFFYGLMMLVMGIEKFQNERKMLGWVYVIVFLLAMFVTIKRFIL